MAILANHFQCDPATLTEPQVRDYFVFLIRDKALRPSSVRQARAALQLFFTQIVRVVGWTVFSEIRTRGSLPLPVVLSRNEVAAVIGAVREDRFRVVLRLIYGCGLRVSEALAVEVGDIDAAGHRLTICEGKGGKPRVVPLPQVLVRELRAYWVTHRHPRFLFPAPGSHWRVQKRATAQDQAAALAAQMRTAEVPMSVSSVQNVMRLAIAASGVGKAATLHTLRHSYATHMLEEGVNLRAVSAYLGHTNLETTAVYLHLTEVSEHRAQEALERLLRLA